MRTVIYIILTMCLYIILLFVIYDYHLVHFIVNPVESTMDKKVLLYLLIHIIILYQQVVLYFL